MNCEFNALLSVIRANTEREARRRLIIYTDGPLVERHLSAQSAFCRACVAMGYLTAAQMEQAARRYRLGMSRDGGVIFWQINQLGLVYDGKVMYYRSDCHRDHGRLPTWVSYVLRSFYLGEASDIVVPSVHCLFGTHLLSNDNVNENRSLNGNDNVNRNLDDKVSVPVDVDVDVDVPVDVPIAVVEAEKTAVILSEVFPQYLWLAAGGLHELTVEKLFALRHHRVVLFPDTDPQRQAFTLWYEIARKARRSYGMQITVSALLERRATADQKRRKIDLVDFYFESQRMGAPNAPL